MSDDDDNNTMIDWNSDDDRDVDSNLQWSPSPSPVRPVSLNYLQLFDAKTSEVRKKIRTC